MRNKETKDKNLSLSNKKNSFAENFIQFLKNLKKKKF